MNAKPDNTLAFIPCRTQSRRLPGKNLRELAGRRLVFRAVDFALSMGFKTVVAPDQEEVLFILEKEYGDKVILFLREPELADGNHQLESWAAAHESCEFVIRGHNKNLEWPFGIMLEPSSPWRNPLDIQACLTGLNHLPAIGTVTRNERIRVNKLQLVDMGGIWAGSLDGRLNIPVTGEPDIVQFNGVCYAARRDTILNQTLWDKLGTHVVEGPSFNIDTLDDFKIAEAFILMREQGGPCWPGT